MNKIERGTCLSCLGSGQVSSERGLSRCPDCEGSGKIGSEFRRSEQRLRQIDAKNMRQVGEAAMDTKWLTSELRRYRNTLMKVMTAAQDGGSDDRFLESDSAVKDLLQRIQFEVNEVLGVYPIEEDK